MLDTPAVATTIARWRCHERLSAAHVARAGAVSVDALRKIEAGHTLNPKRATLDKIARGLATDPHTLECNLALVQRIADDLRRTGESGESPGPARGCPGPSPWCWTSSEGFCGRYASDRVSAHG